MNIYVANLNTALTDTDLAALFAPFGQVHSASVAIDGFTDKSRGFGYVNMPDEQEAQAAIAALDKLNVEGQALSVEVAQTQTIHRGSYKVGNPAVQGFRFRKN